MGKAMFYHLTRSTVEETLRLLLPKAVEQGWPVYLRGRDPALLARLDEALWLLPADAFLPHGMQGSPQDARQPVLLGLGAMPPGARVLALVDRASVSLTETAGLERLWVIFDAADAGELDAARTLWRDIAAAGNAAEYWSEDSGRWVMKQERQPEKPAD